MKLEQNLTNSSDLIKTELKALPNDLNLNGENVEK